MACELVVVWNGDRRNGRRGYLEDALSALPPPRDPDSADEAIRVERPPWEPPRAVSPRRRKRPRRRRVSALPSQYRPAPLPFMTPAS